MNDIKILFLNADDNGTIAKTILAGCYKFGRATLLRSGGGDDDERNRG